MEAIDGLMIDVMIVHRFGSSGDAAHWYHWPLDNWLSKGASLSGHSMQIVIEHETSSSETVACGDRRGCFARQMIFAALTSCWSSGGCCFGVVCSSGLST